MKTHDEARALDELAPAYDNLRAALHWALERGEGELAPRLAIAVYHLLYRKGFWAEARRCLEAGLAAAEAAPGDSRALGASIRHALASIAIDTGEREPARALAEACLALRRELRDAAGTAEALNLLAILAVEAKAWDEARALLDEALALLPERDHARRGIVLHNLARVASGGGDDAASRRLYEQALLHRRAAGDARGEAETLGNLGVLAYNAQDHEEARRLYLESLEILQRLRDRHWTAVMLYNLGELAEEEGDTRKAVALYFHSQRIFQDLQSALVQAPAGRLAALSAGFAPEAWTALLEEAAHAGWEALVSAG
jgi:tetratricopeptide (TPR) repeat protein